MAHYFITPTVTIRSKLPLLEAARLLEAAGGRQVPLTRVEYLEALYPVVVVEETWASGSLELKLRSTLTPLADEELSGFIKRLEATLFNLAEPGSYTVEDGQGNQEVVFVA